MICTISDVNQINLFAASSERDLAESGEPTLAALQAQLESEGAPAEVLELGSLREVAEAGLPAEG